MTTVSEAKRILVVDDEPKIVETIRAYLENSGYVVFTAENGVEALTREREDAPDLVILDLMLPDIAGEQVCKVIRAVSAVPIIMLTAKSDEESFINGLQIGADDYVTKPFSPKMLVAKVDALLRRAAVLPEETKIVDNNFSCGELTLDNVAHTVRKNSKLIDLTPNEYNLLLALLKSPDKLFTRRELVSIALGESYGSDDRMIDSYIKQLRQKLEDDPKSPVYIKTVHGLGYKLGGGSQ